jgi:hypothetical protein
MPVALRGGGGTTVVQGLSGSLDVQRLQSAHEVGLDGAVTPTGLLVREPQLVRAGATDLSGSLDVQRLQSAHEVGLDGAVTPTGLLVREPQLVRAGAADATGLLVREARLVRAGATAPSGALVREARRGLPGGLTPAGNLAVRRIANRSFGGTTGPSGLMRLHWAPFVAASSGGTAVITLPTFQADDIVVLAFYHNATSTPTISAGWSVVANAADTASRLVVWYRVMQAGDLAPTVTSTATFACWAAASYRAARQPTAPSVSGQATAPSGSTSANVTPGLSFTSAVRYSRILSIHAAVAESVTYTADAATTERIEGAAVNPSGTEPSIMLADEWTDLTGNAPSRTATMSAATGQKCSATVVIQWGG